MSTKSKIVLEDAGPTIGDASFTKCENIKLIKIKWICPTTATRPKSLFVGFPSNACKAYRIPIFFI
uniref:Uncharacterized protein n=1 Tax=Cucumis melo TaxID=3656 RepID=A0A9I9E6T4_CUCME